MKVRMNLNPKKGQKKKKRIINIEQNNKKRWLNNTKKNVISNILVKENIKNIT